MFNNKFVMVLLLCYKNNQKLGNKELNEMVKT